MTKPRVIFASTVFDEISTGPALYAQTLWRAFADDPEIDFHVVAPAFREQHPRLHAAGASGSVYQAVCATAIELAKGREGNTLIHGNAAHAMTSCIDYPG